MRRSKRRGWTSSPSTGMTATPFSARYIGRPLGPAAAGAPRKRDASITNGSDSAIGSTPKRSARLDAMATAVSGISSSGVLNRCAAIRATVRLIAAPHLREAAARRRPMLSGGLCRRTLEARQQSSWGGSSAD